LNREQGAGRIVYSQLPTPNSQLPTTNSQLPTLFLDWEDNVSYENQTYYELMQIKSLLKFIKEIWTAENFLPE
ncbi:hypothetical protein, partial [Moorena sp. SIO2C4]|uniref:hypothetical protein n=1 Tax=Moorena sp. SIO2C4 TaxID=2607824 RepID=UPI0013CB94E1